MNANQQNFAAAIAAGVAPKMAAIGAGYNPVNARIIAWRLLNKHTGVRLEIARIRAGKPRLTDLLPPEATPLQYLAARMGDPYVEPRIRVRCAQHAVRYIKAGA